MTFRRGDFGLAAAFLSAAGARMVNAEPAHEASGKGHEVQPIGKGKEAAARYLNVSLAKNGGGSNTHGRLVRKLGAGEAMEFCVERCKEVIRDGFILTLCGFK